MERIYNSMDSFFFKYFQQFLAEHYYSYDKFIKNKCNNYVDSDTNVLYNEIIRHAAMLIIFYIGYFIINNNNCLMLLRDYRALCVINGSDERTIRYSGCGCWFPPSNEKFIIHVGWVRETSPPFYTIRNGAK